MDEEADYINGNSEQIRHKATKDDATTPAVVHEHWSPVPSAVGPSSNAPVKVDGIERATSEEANDTNAASDNDYPAVASDAAVLARPSGWQSLVSTALPYSSVLSLTTVL